MVSLPWIIPGTVAAAFRKRFRPKSCLHLRAGNWFAANGFVEESVKHALLSGDTAVAVAIFAPTSYALIENERWLQLENLLNRFPPDVIEESPQLLLLVVGSSLTRMPDGAFGNHSAKAGSIRGKENLTAQERRFLDCSINLFAAFKHTWAAESESLLLVHRLLCLQSSQSGVCCTDTPLYISVHDSLLAWWPRGFSDFRQ